MRRGLQAFAAACLLSAGALPFGCKYIAQPDSDPVDPVPFSIVNMSGNTVYLPLSDGVTPLGAALHLAPKGEGELRPRLACADALCSDGCGVGACGVVSAVRALGPGEALLVEWNNMHFVDGSMSCAGVDTACFTPVRAARGNYEVTLCYGAAPTPAMAGLPLQRSATDAQVISAATTDASSCIGPLSFQVPGGSVHWEIDIK